MIRTLQTNMTGGALSADSQDRLDLAVWKNGVATAENVRLHPQGGASRRPGLALVDNNQGNYWTEDRSYQIEPFIFSADQQYVFVFMDGNINVYFKDSRTILEQLGTPYPGALIANNELSIVQSFDTMLVFHKDYETRSITRNNAGLFDVGTLQWSPFDDGTVAVQRPPFHKYAQAHVTMWTDGPTNNPDVGYVDLYTSDPVFQEGHIGTWFNLRGCYIYCVGVINPAFALGIMTTDIPDWETHSIEWQEQAFSPVRGWPACGVRHQQRLWLAGAPQAPNTIWASTTYDPYNFFLGQGADTDAIKYTADSDRVAEIKRMVSYQHLQVFTADAEFYAPTPQSGALTPGTMSLLQQSAYGIANAPAIRFDQSTIFITRAAGAVREYVYDNLQGSYSADAMTLMARDLIRDPIDLDAAMETDYAQEALGIVTNSDGTLAVLSKVRKENVSAWTLWITSGIIRRVGVVQREIWAVVDRLLTDGVTWQPGLEVFDINYGLDFAAGYTASDGPTDTWTFPRHAGMDVTARSGNLTFGIVHVGDDGIVVVPDAVATLEVGLAFMPTIIPLVQEVQLPDGLSWGLPKRICSTTLSLDSTISAQIDRDVMPIDNADMDPGEAPDPFTGKFKSWRLGWGTDEAPVITFPDPFDFYLKSILQEVEV